MASIIWIELVQQAAKLGTAQAPALAKGLTKRARAADGSITHQELSAIEQEMRSLVAGLAVGIPSDQGRA